MSTTQIPPYAIGSDTLPGLAKLAEEIGELQQVIGKIMALGHAGDHWDGTNLTNRLVEEIGDVQAAIWFFGERNPSVPNHAVSQRAKEKWGRFHDWHTEAVRAKGGDA